MSSASTAQAVILFGVSAVALISEILSLLVLKRGGWEMTRPHMAIATLIVWDTILGIYAFFQAVTGLSRITLTTHLRSLLLFIVSGYTVATISSILAPDINREGNLFGWLSANFLLSAMVFYLVFVAENYGHPAIGDKIASDVGGRLQLENQVGHSFSPASAIQAAFLALGGVEAGQSVVTTLALLPSVSNDPADGIKRDQIFWTAWVFGLILVYGLVTLIARITRRAIWVRTVRADLMMLFICVIHGVEEAHMMLRIPSPVEHIFLWVCLGAMFSAFAFETTYLCLYGGWDTLKTNTTFADLAGAPELPAPPPVENGSGFMITQTVLLAGVALFATGGLALLAESHNTWVAEALLAWFAILLLYLALHVAGHWVSGLASWHKVNAELTALGFLFDAGLLVSILATVLLQHDHRALVLASAWASTAALLVVLVFEAGVVKSHYGPLKTVGDRSLLKLAEWKAGLETENRQAQS
ncbi:hypothetical protein CC85DRAFT_314025 [Cutaneotrichosporon oleaginosum]|uniref:Uncharacterized protein n=1 Tax=Cutaneotrichosporon oleaginosum TaxID=879819 RepID=A0A0J0XDS8_9TREE|nr:uncharacterized protein CC85DRAFT_314025 [Cutaneotrichosporon oleaginosum]KLT39173.1 hypothetical protein CC85DRAFT_314025 [Cutaneotrichosporon oleaginosum]TXT05309.1 hypothetical protein COLE_06629 [Cutaneotrichosporon oleaginosum]